MNKPKYTLKNNSENRKEEIFTSTDIELLQKLQTALFYTGVNTFIFKSNMQK